MKLFAGVLGLLGGFTLAARPVHVINDTNLQIKLLYSTCKPPINEQNYSQRQDKNLIDSSILLLEPHQTKELYIQTSCKIPLAITAYNNDSKAVYVSRPASIVIPQEQTEDPLTLKLILDPRFDSLAFFVQKESS